MAFFDDPEQYNAQDKTETPQRKIGYVADRFETKEKTMQTELQEKQAPYMITDWASF